MENHDCQKNRLPFMKRCFVDLESNWHFCSQKSDSAQITFFFSRHMGALYCFLHLACFVWSCFNACMPG